MGEWNCNLDTSPEKGLAVNFDFKLDWPQSQSGRIGEQRNFLLLPGIKLQ
jgi:hypothetical protein